mmetsp:Transcript_29225/g.56455  ORF Transcript_29225/g.56455 Transcript_29225/m.56455 type:complete len:255 (-) Transcript_29225:527-1291(-)
MADGILVLLIHLAALARCNLAVLLRDRSHVKRRVLAEEIGARKACLQLKLVHHSLAQRGGPAPEPKSENVNRVERRRDHLEKGLGEHADTDGALHRRLDQRLSQQCRAEKGPKRHLEPAARHAAHVERRVRPRGEQKDAEEAVALGEGDGPHLEPREHVALALGLLKLSLERVVAAAGSPRSASDEVWRQLANGGAGAPENHRWPHENELVEKRERPVVVRPPRLVEARMVVHGVELGGALGLRVDHDLHHKGP